MPPLNHPPTPEGGWRREVSYYSYRTSNNNNNNNRNKVTNSDKESSNTLDTWSERGWNGVASTSAAAAASSAVVAGVVTASSLPKMTLSSGTGPSPENVWIRALVERRMKQWHQMRQRKHYCQPSPTLYVQQPVQHGGEILKGSNTNNRTQRSTTTSTNTQRRQKKVTFSSSQQVRRIPLISFQSDPELAYALWHTGVQFWNMRDRCNLLVELLQHKIVEPYNYDSDTDDDDDDYDDEDIPKGSIIQNDDYCSIGFDARFGTGKEIANALQTGGQAAGECCYFWGRWIPFFPMTMLYVF
jgi:hypothetical protein